LFPELIHSTDVALLRAVDDAGTALQTERL